MLRNESHYLPWIRVQILKSNLDLNLDSLALVNSAISLSDGDNNCWNVFKVLNRMPGNYHKFNKL